MSTGYVHGSTTEREIARLEKQGDWTAAFSFPRFDAQPGMRVLDLACGVGAMAARLERSFPGIQLVGVDLSAGQLNACRKNHPEVPVARGDGTRLPFGDETFDRVHCTWLLEHVPDPIAVLREVRRVLKPHGRCHFVEVDNFSFASTPHLRDVSELLHRLNRAQEEAGGDPGVGVRLAAHFRAAGFTDVVVEPVRLHGTQKDPAFLEAFIDEFAEIFDGLGESLGADALPLIDAAARALRGLVTRPEAELFYTAFIATAGPLPR